MGDMSHSSETEGMKKFYQDFADLTAIVWAYHKKRLDAGLPFALFWDKAQGDYVTFDPSTIFEQYGERETLSIVELFGDGVAISLALSCVQLFELNERSIPSVLVHPEITPENNVDFKSKYIQDLIDLVEASTHLSYLQRYSEDHLSAETIFGIGAITGGNVTAHLRALFGESYTTVTPILLSRTSIEKSRYARAQVGVRERDTEGNPIPVSLRGMDTSHHSGLCMKMLADHDKGTALGCIASMMPTEATLTFLEGLGCRPDGIMLKNYAERLSDEFRVYVLGWYENLCDRERHMMVHPYDRSLLEGDAFRPLREK